MYISSIDHYEIFRSSEDDCSKCGRSIKIPAVICDECEANTIYCSDECYDQPSIVHSFRQEETQ